METQGHNLPLDAGECRKLVRGRRVGRIGWSGVAGQSVQPVVYAVDGETIVFRTAHGTLLSELVAGLDACLEVDDLDEETATGWSVLVRGTSGPGDASLAGLLDTPWAPGDRPVIVVITPREYTGRAVSAD